MGAPQGAVVVGVTDGPDARRGMAAVGVRDLRAARGVVVQCPVERDLDDDPVRGRDRRGRGGGHARRGGRRPAARRNDSQDGGEHREAVGYRARRGCESRPSAAGPHAPGPDLAPLVRSPAPSGGLRRSRPQDALLVGANTGAKVPDAAGPSSATTACARAGTAAAT